MYTLYKFHFLNGISEINQLFDDILIIWPAPVYIGVNQTALVRLQAVQNAAARLLTGSRKHEHIKPI